MYAPEGAINGPGTLPLRRTSPISRAGGEGAVYDFYYSSSRLAHPVPFPPTQHSTHTPSFSTSSSSCGAQTRMHERIGNTHRCIDSQRVNTIHYWQIYGLATFKSTSRHWNTAPISACRSHSSMFFCSYIRALLILHRRLVGFIFPLLSVRRLPTTTTAKKITTTPTTKPTTTTDETESTEQNFSSTDAVGSRRFFFRMGNSGDDTPVTTPIRSTAKPSNTGTTLGATSALTDTTGGGAASAGAIGSARSTVISQLTLGAL
ncbi:hypothetical protein K438DRAFT_1783220 [Mycena galopus ATCC 62051]|nr:hypothetical protein K438DRAFT_1783220 [Mycena galopus ATCC 62051]